MNETKNSNKAGSTVREHARVQYGVIVYPRTGNVRQFVALLASSEPYWTMVVWDAGFARLIR